MVFTRHARPGKRNRPRTFVAKVCHYLLLWKLVSKLFGVSGSYGVAQKSDQTQKFQDFCWAVGPAGRLGPGGCCHVLISHPIPDSLDF